MQHPRVPLGQSGLHVTPVGLGSWQFSEGKGGAVGSWGALTEQQTDTIVAAALDGGISWFDTAEIYGWGASERGLARALQVQGVQPGEVVLATKWNPLLRFAGSIRSTFPARREALAPYPVDLHQVHFPASIATRRAEMLAMADLAAEGSIRAVGVSNFSAGQMRRAHAVLQERGLVLASNQVKFNLWDRSIETNGVLDTARELGISIIAYSPLGMGLLTGKFHDDPSRLNGLPISRRLQLRWALKRSRPLIDALGAIADAKGVTRTQVAIAWVVQRHGETVLAIPGATKPHHAEEAAAAMKVELTEADFRRLDEAGR